MGLPIVDEERFLMQMLIVKLTLDLIQRLYVTTGSKLPFPLNRNCIGLLVSSVEANVRIMVILFLFWFCVKWKLQR